MTTTPLNRHKSIKTAVTNIPIKLCFTNKRHRRDSFNQNCPTMSVGHPGSVGKRTYGLDKACRQKV